MFYRDLKPLSFALWLYTPIKHSCLLINSANSDNFVNAGVNSLTNNTPSNNREIQNEEEVEDPLNEHAAGYVHGKIFLFSRMKPKFTQLCI